MVKRKLDLDYIKKLREENHYSQAYMAEQLGLKSTDKYTRRENGQYNFQSSELPILSDLLNTPIEKFFTLESSKIAHKEVRT